MLEISITRNFKKITHIFSRAMWLLPRELFDLVIESLSKVRGLKKYRARWQKREHVNEKLISKWEIHIKDTLYLKNPMHLEITHPPLNHGCQVSDSWHGTQAVNKLMPPAFLCWASVSASRVLNSTTQALSSSPALLCPLGHAFCWAHSRWLINSYRGNQWNVKRPWVDSPRSLCYERQGALQQRNLSGQ